MFKCFFHYRLLQVRERSFICVPAVSGDEYLVSIFEKENVVDLRKVDQPPLVNAYYNHYLVIRDAVALRSTDPQDYYRYFWAEQSYLQSMLERAVVNEYKNIPVGDADVAITH